MEKFIEIGTKVGLSGNELLDFIRKEFDKEKEELREKEEIARLELKAKEDQARLEKKEREEIARLERKEKEALERERDERVRAEKIEREAIEREERLEERALKKIELENAQRAIELEIELQKAKIKSHDDASLSSKHIQAKLPKLPHFVDGKDHIDAYLKRFERFAKNANWDKTHWATNLSALLQGKALDVYSRLSAEDATNYDKLKESLLKRFQLTEEGFRMKLRTSRMEEGETAQQFVVRLDEYIHRWMDLANSERSFEGLKDLMLREQFMQASSKNLQVFLKERKCEDVNEMAKFADQYLEAHGVIPDPNRDLSRNKAGQNRAERESQNRSDFVRHCYNCGSTSHLVRDCPSYENAAAMVTPSNSYSQRGKGRFNKKNFVGRGGHRGGMTRDQTPQSDESQKSDSKGTNEDVGAFVQERLPEQTVVLDSKQELPSMSGSCTDNRCKSKNMPVVEGYLGDRKVKVLRDSGCSSAVVRRDLVKVECMTGETQKCVLIDGTVRRFPIAQIPVDTPYYTGTIRALCTENPIYDLVIGNISGVRDPKDVDPEWGRMGHGVREKSREREDPQSEVDMNTDEKQSCDHIGKMDESREQLSAVQTRAQKAKGDTRKPLKVAECVDSIGVDEVREKQRVDKSFDKARERVQSRDKKVSKEGAVSWFEQKGGLLFRYFQSATVDNNKLFKQLCVPDTLRKQVMKLAHDSTMGGHLGIKKTSDKILSQFWWPGISADVKRFCRSCDICQKTFPKGKVSKIPIGRMPLIDTPFARVAVDLVGPINPPSERGYRFILTLVDYATRYPEAKALKRIDSETVAEALVEIFSRVGVPQEILSDMGKQFTSDLMKEVGRLLSLKQLTTAPYNPACNGLVERFNGTLKTMLKKMCCEQPKEWDRYISPLLFAYREAPQESLGFSPFELLYGRTVRGPLNILKELWTKDIQTDEVKTTYEYVVDLRNRLEETLELARKELKSSSQRYRKYANVGKKQKLLKAGDKCLILLPTSNNKLLMHLQGPYLITEKVNDFDYKVKVKGKEKIYHSNLLRKYIERGEEGRSDVQSQVSEASGLLDIVAVAVVEDEKDELIESERGESLENKVNIELPVLKATETVKDVKINPELGEDRQLELRTLLYEFEDVFTDVPGDTDLIEHDIKLISNEPVRSKAYPMPYAMRDSFRSDIAEMLRLDIIEPVDSPYAAPVVIVKKSDGSNRICIDFRKLNAITVFDSEPIGNPDEIFSSLADDNFFSKVDLSKGYWQIRVKKECIPLTAFICSEGLFAFKRMPFGMVNSGSTFCKMMRKLLKGLLGVDNFVDDILNHTKQWDFHLVCLRRLFERLRGANLTAKPSKCMFGYPSIGFLGHVVGKGQIQPNPDKVEQIRMCKRPSNKKQVRSFLGLVGYYRKFIPHFSTIASVLTDMTKKGAPNLVVWSDKAELAFRTLINHVTQTPILCLPDFTQQFILRTDASDTGIGAVLMQSVGETKFPVAFASRKLLPRESQYSVIEKEGLAIVWAVQKFNQYLYGTEFILETDHAPLVYLNKAKCVNQRVMRWALSLQPFRFRLEAIKGSENVGADFLSRIGYIGDAISTVVVACLIL